MTKSKLAFFLPNIFTALNMACGFASVLLSVQGKIYEGAMILILGAVFDSVDGRVARITGTSSSFGEQFDSLSDLISFGMAPAILVYQKYLYSYGRLGAVVSFIFLLCAALRLARFNANIEKVGSSFFQGLPSPGAALGIIGAIIFSTKFTFIDNFSFVFLPYTAFYGILMITTIPFYSFKDSEFARKYRKISLSVVFLIIAATVSFYRIMLPFGLAVYILGSIIYYIKHRRDSVDIFHWIDENES